MDLYKSPLLLHIGGGKPCRYLTLLKYSHLQPSQYVSNEMYMLAQVNSVNTAESSLLLRETQPQLTNTSEKATYFWENHEAFSCDHSGKTDV